MLVFFISYCFSRFHRSSPCNGCMPTTPSMLHFFALILMLRRVEKGILIQGYSSLLAACRFDPATVIVINPLLRLYIKYDTINLNLLLNGYSQINITSTCRAFILYNGSDRIHVRINMKVNVWIRSVRGVQCKCNTECTESACATVCIVCPPGWRRPRSPAPARATRPSATTPPAATPRCPPATSAAPGAPTSRGETVPRSKGPPSPCRRSASLRPYASHRIISDHRSP